MTTKHPDYAVLAARIAVSNLHKETKKNFSKVIEDLYNYSACFISNTLYGSNAFLSVNPKNNKPSGLISKETYEVVIANRERLDSAIIYNRDFHYN